MDEPLWHLQNTHIILSSSPSIHPGFIINQYGNRGNTSNHIAKCSMSVFLTWIFSSSSYDSTHFRHTLHLAYWLQMQLPDFFLIGPSGQLSAGAQLKANIVLCLVRIAFFPMCRLPKLEHTFKRMAQINGKQAFGQSVCTSHPENQRNAL